MEEEHGYILCYDIEFDDLREGLSDYLIRHGWQRIQYSVFQKTTTDEEVTTLRGFLTEQDVFSSRDDVRIFHFVGHYPVTEKKRIRFFKD